MRKPITLLGIAGLLLAGTVDEVGAAPTPSARLVKVTSASKPVDIASRRGDDGLYIAEQDGLVVRYVPKTKTKTTALDLTSFTGAAGERGLLGITFHPDGRSMYVNYTDATGDTIVARFRMVAGNLADPASRVELFSVEQPYANHNGGGLAFGPSNRLYIGTGDGGSRDDPQRFALDRKSMLGKIISIDPLAPNKRTADPRIWSVGLRNPWRFEFDDDMNLWVADVGQDKWEEVSVAWATSGSGRNANFGWSAYEGFDRFNKDQSARNHLAPVYVYEHGDDGCSISGGTRVRSRKLPTLTGWYVFGDYCTGHITAIKVNGKKTTSVARLVENAGSVTAVRTVSSGDVYVLELGGTVSLLTKKG